MTKTSKPKQNTPKSPYEIERKSDGTIVLTITVEWNVIEKKKEEIITNLLSHVEIPGFRKGKAPRAVAEKKLSDERVREETLKGILTDFYIEAVKHHQLKPIINPLIHVETFVDGTNLVFTAETCEEPVASLGKYKDAIKNVTAKSKIIVPGKEKEKVSLDEVVQAAMKEVAVTIPKILIDNESSRLLSQLLDEVKTLGMTLDQYLSSKGITSDQLKQTYEIRAEEDLKLEFFLRKVADEEKITVEPKDITEALNSIENEAQRQEVAQNPYLVASIIRQQKTLDFLTKI